MAIMGGVGSCVIKTLLYMRNPNHIFDNLSECLLKSKLDVSALIPIVEEMIAAESAILEANRVIENLPAYLDSEYKVTHCQILRCLLSRCRRDL